MHWWLCIGNIVDRVCTAFLACQQLYQTSDWPASGLVSLSCRVVAPNSRWLAVRKTCKDSFLLSFVSKVCSYHDSMFTFSKKKANRKLYYMVSNSPFLNFYSHLQDTLHFMPFSGTWGIEWSDAWPTVSAMQSTLSWPQEIWQVLGSPENLIFYGITLCLCCQIVQVGVIF